MALYRCPLCGKPMELFVVPVSPPSHGCPKKRGEPVTFVKEKP